jgi:hypothetical protein
MAAATPLRLVGVETASELTDRATARLWSALAQPFELSLGERFVDHDSGQSWIYRGGTFERTPEHDVVPDDAFVRDFLARHPGWPE